MDAGNAAFADNCFQKCSWGHAVISTTKLCLFLMQCCLRAQRSQLFSTGYLLQTGIFSFNDIIFLQMIPKFFTILHQKTNFLKYLKYLPTLSSTEWWTSPHLHFWKTQPLWYPLFILMLLINTICCEMFHLSVSFCGN